MTSQRTRRVVGRLVCGVLTAVAAASGLPAMSQGVEFLPGIEWPEPEVITPGAAAGQAPSDAVVLFDGTNLDAWENGENWKVEDGVATVGTGPIITKQKFGDLQFHLEWSAPVPATGESQGRGNSGVFFVGDTWDVAYEVQVLDSYENETYFDGQAGAIYKQMPPMVNAMRPPGEWNTYDIVWTQPRFHDDGTLKSPACVTVIHNGVLLQNHFEVKGTTWWHQPPTYQSHSGGLRISLQDHGNPVRFRNIWVREWKRLVGKQAKPPGYIDHGTGKTWEHEEKAGK